MRGRLPQSAASPMTVADLNTKLDVLAACKSSDERESVIRYFYINCTLSQQIWIVKIILKDLDISMSETTILPLFHPDAYQYFQTCSDLRQLCNDLADPNFKLQSFKVRLFCPFSPQLSRRCDRPEDIVNLMQHKEFWTETKLDGERIQMHMKNQVFEWWSRNTKDYSDLYGRNFSAGSLSPFLKDAFNPITESCILDGEMLSYNVEKNVFEPFGTLKTAANELMQNSTWFLTR
jgi:DNA ligase-4